ncbi:MAG: hypothetical protein KAI95_16630 [Bacteroidales bacterium]|nr:hypothetical protein [Bacteroidales bacterium]
MVKLEPTQRKIPVRKLLIYLLLVIAVILVLISLNRISLIFQTFFPLSN